MPKETPKRTYLYIRWAYKQGGGGGGLISGINIAKTDELISGGGFKPGGLNVGFYGSIFFIALTLL